jgi:hypothetical protein
VVHAAALPAVDRFLPCLFRYRGEGIVEDHHQVFGAQRLAAVMAHSDEFLALIVALSAFPAHYRVIPSR